MAALEGASKYLNNLLLARGLLPGGKSIDFANSKHGKEYSEATMTSIINLVHDLVLRRDRESERHEAMATTIRNLRIAEKQHVLESQQMQDSNQQLKNDVTAAQSKERGNRACLKMMENTIKELKEQNLKMKSMLDQVRAKCTSDVRKRDVEIEKLKVHILGLQRGKKDSGGMRIKVLNPQAAIVGKKCKSGQDANNADWTLEKETNDFLAELVNETSAENVSLRRIVSDTLSILKDMSGYEECNETEEVDEDGIGIPGQYRKSRQPHTETLIPIDSLAQDIDTILRHCRTILRDPSFVPIEEVQIREVEIAKLREGWEKMADRWKEAITMMSQWKQRMMLEGKEDDAVGFSHLSFVRSIAIRPDGQPVLGHDSELSAIFEESKCEEDSIASIPAEASVQTESDLDLEPEPVLKRLASSPAKRGIRLARPHQPLSEVSGNIDHHLSDRRSPTHVIVSTIDSDTENYSIVHDSKSDAPKLNIAQKLAAVEAEALEVVSIEQTNKTRKRKTLSKDECSKRSGRGRSTLNPEELASLIGAR